MNEELDMDMDLEIVELGDAKEETKGFGIPGKEDSPLLPRQV